MDKEMIKPYFPYGIRVAVNGCYKETSKITELKDTSFFIEDYWRHVLKIPYDTDEYKLVLHPMTVEHLYTPLRVNSQQLIVADHLCSIVYENITDILPAKNSDWLVKMIVSYFNDWTPCPFSKNIMSKLCSVLYALHFDLFGYIDRRLARNVCEMNYDSYEFDEILL